MIGGGGKGGEPVSGPPCPHCGQTGNGGHGGGCPNGGQPAACVHCGRPFRWWQLVIVSPRMNGKAHRGCAIDAGDIPKPEL